MKQLIRDFQIDLIMGNKTNPIIELFDNIWGKLTVVEVNVYHNNGGEFIFYDTNNMWVFFIDADTGKFFANYDNYWNIIVTKFNLRYSLIKIYTNLLVENELGKSLPKVGYRKESILGKLDRALETVLKNKAR